MAKKILEILIEEKIIDEVKREIALERQIKMGGKIGGHLLALGFINPKQLAEALSKRMNIPEVDPEVLNQINKNLINEFPIHLAKKHIALPLIKIKDTISVAFANPKNLDAINAVKIQTGYNVRPFVAPESLIKEKIIEYYRIDKSYLLPDDPTRELSKESLLDQDMFDYSKTDRIDAYIPGSETLLTLEESPKQDESPEKSKDYRFVAAPQDPFVLGLTQVRSLEQFAHELVNTLFLGLDRMMVFELYSDRIEHVASKNWPQEKNNHSIKIKSQSINFYLLLQESVYYGAVNQILTNDVIKIFLNEDLQEPDKYLSVFIVLTYGNSPLYLIYGDLNGQPIPKKYCMTWKNMQPKFEEALEYLVTYFDIETFL